MTRTDVYIAVAVMAGLAGCDRGAVGDEYHCRVTQVSDVESRDGPVVLDNMAMEFVFTVETESDTAVAGKVPGVWTNRYGETPFVNVSKLDGAFRAMQVQLGDRSTYFDGFCKPRA